MWRIVSRRARLGQVQVEPLAGQHGVGDQAVQRPFQLADAGAEVVGDVGEHRRRARPRPAPAALALRIARRVAGSGASSFTTIPPRNRVASSSVSLAICRGCWSAARTIGTPSAIRALNVWRNSSCVARLAARKWMSSTTSASAPRYRDRNDLSGAASHGVEEAVGERLGRDVHEPQSRPTRPQTHARSLRAGASCPGRRPPWITSGLNDAPSDCAISTAAACARRLPGPVTKSSSRRVGRDGWRRGAIRAGLSARWRPRRGFGAERHLDLGLPPARRAAVGSITWPTFGLGLAVDPERQAERLARDRLGGLDQVAGEVALDPLAEERVGDADLQGVAIDPEPHPLAEPEPEPAMPSRSATASRNRVLTAPPRPTSADMPRLRSASTKDEGRRELIVRIVPDLRTSRPGVPCFKGHCRDSNQSDMPSRVPVVESAGIGQFVYDDLPCPAPRKAIESALSNREYRTVDCDGRRHPLYITLTRKPFG